MAPDLYWRQEPNVQLNPATADGRARAVELMKRLGRNQAVADGAAALAATREAAACDASTSGQADHTWDLWIFQFGRL